jgi:serine/threonine-protein kinase
MSGTVTTLGGLRIFRDEIRVQDIANQPLRAALLVYLAVEGECTRDSVMGRLWPDRDPRRARHALSQTVYELRQQLGEGWIHGSGEVMRIGPHVHVDTRDFEAGVAEGRAADALRLYQGEFLQGTYLAGNNEFEVWVDVQRSRLRRLHRAARRDALEHARSSGRDTEALQIARTWAEIEPFDDEAQLRYVEMLAETGHRTEALQHYETYRKRLASEEGELEPLDELVHLVQRIRTGEAGRKARASQKKPLPPAVGGAIQRLGEIHPPPSEPPTTSIAVLPFVNLSPEPETEYLSDGITEDLINVFAQLGYMHVAARTSSFAFKNKDMDVRELGQKLNVRWVVEGSVRKVGQRLRVAARLVNALDGYPFWSGRYDRDVQDILHIQEEISSEIARAASSRVVEQLPVLHSTEKPEAYRLYLLGRFHWNRRTPDALETALQAFRSSTEIDPGYALGYCGIADVLVAQAQFGYKVPREVLPLAEAACERATELDPVMAEGWPTRAHVMEVQHWDFAAAETMYRKALAMNPRDGNAHAWFGSMLCAQGRFGEALHHTRTASQIEPYSLAIRFQHGSVHYRARNFDQALLEFAAATDMNPMYYPAPIFMSFTHQATGRFEDALTVAQATLERFGKLPAGYGAAGRAYALLGNREKALENAAMLDAIRKVMYTPAIHSVLLFAPFDRDAAFHWLERAFDERFGQLMFLNVDPLFDPLRDDPRYPGFLRQLHLE